ncbi:hypothetical protein [Streptomyces canus]|uniref:hypothetical protein n=1 Tax=Streptomyces canus TaxID=58343 RepID=UPI0027859B21|nr:hypothetical protein [Streptomyces canus]MDQ0758768.1 hypothetical protein [Streptomyces canus]
MATVIEARPLDDLEQDAIARVDVEMARRARGVKPWTTTEYVDQIDRVHARYNQRRTWLRLHEQEAA